MKMFWNTTSKQFASIIAPFFFTVISALNISLNSSTVLLSHLNQWIKAIFLWALLRHQRWLFLRQWIFSIWDRRLSWWQATELTMLQTKRWPCWKYYLIFYLTCLKVHLCDSILLILPIHLSMVSGSDTLTSALLTVLSLLLMFKAALSGSVSVKNC